MGKLLKITLSVFAGLVVLIIAAIIALFLFVDPNNFKPEIEAAVKDNIGRTLTIEGDLNLSVFPWIGISTENMTLSNAPGFNDISFATIESSDIKVKLLPLFKQELEVSRIILKGLVLNLEKNKQGINNWDDLSKSEQQPPLSMDQGQPPSTAPMAFLAIGGLAIENARIIWDDQQTGKHNEIDAFNLHSESIKFDQPVGIDLSFIILGKQSTQNQSVSLTTSLIANKALDNFRLDKLKLQTVAQGENIPGGKLTAEINAKINLNLTNQTVQLKDLQLNSEDLVINAELSGASILDQPIIKGTVSIEQLNPRKLMHQLSLQLPLMQDNNAFKQFSMQFNLQANTDSADISNINITLDDTRLTGSASARNFEHPAYTFNFDIDAINLDRYLPEEQQSSASTKSGDPAQTANTPAVTVAAGATLIPVDTLKKLNAKGQLTIGKLHVSKTNMHGVQVNLSANKGIIKTEQSVNDLYKGKYTGSINIDVTRKQPSLTLNEKITQLQIQPLLKDRNSKIRMTGTASGSAKLQARGNRIEDIKSSLSGLVSFAFNNGVIKGFNLQNIIKNSISLIEGKPLPKSNYNDQTRYSTIRGNINFINGIALNDDLLAKAPDLRVTGKGKAYLTTEKLDYQIIGRLLKSEATATEPEKIEGVPVHIIIGGTFSEPVYAPDVIAMLTDKSNPEIEKKKQKLLDKVDKKFGSDVKNILKQFF